MSDTANVAQGAYQRFFGGSPATAESGIRDTASARGWHGEPISHSLAGELGELHSRERNNSLIDSPANLERLIKFHRLTRRPNESASWAMRVVCGPTGEHLVRVPHWFSEGDSGTVEYGHPANSGSYLSGSMSLPAALHSGTGTAELLLHDDRDLKKALSDLDSLNAEAKEEDLPEPDAEAVANARTLLPRLYAILPARFRVSPTERRGVAIDAPMKWGASVAVECAPDDTVYCFATIDGNSRRAKFYQMDGLPDVFIEKALRDLAAG